jgi:DNA-3-methyladenine glycosylase
MKPSVPPSQHIAKLPRSFYLRPTLTVAKDVLGKLVVRKLRGRLLIGRIVEVEAYLGEKDPASHAYRGKTMRNEVMFRKGGHLYVYFTYGMHFCANIVTEEEGIGRAVLIRGVEPVEAVEELKKNRSRNVGLMDKWSIDALENLTNGPAKFCQAFGIARKENGSDLLGDEIFLAEGDVIPKSQIGSSTRIGIRNATQKRWRFYVKGNGFVSKR